MLVLSPLSSLPDLALRPSGASSPTTPVQPDGADFGSLLGQLASSTAGTLRQGEAAAIAGIEGSLPLQTVVDRMMAAERTLQAALAVRDKAVGAYQEISRMQI